MLLHSFLLFCLSQLVLDCFPQQQQALLAQLAQHPDQQFAFLKGLVAIQQREVEAGSGAPLQASSRTAALSTLLDDMDMANLYLRLLCQYEPQSGEQTTLVNDAHHW